MEKAAVTSNGRIVLPLRLRKKYKLKKGIKVSFINEDGVIKLIPITPARLLGTKGKLLKALMKEKKSERNI